MPVYQRFLPFLAGLVLIIIELLLGTLIDALPLYLVVTSLLFLAGSWFLGRFLPFQQKGAGLFIALPALFTYLSGAASASWLNAVVYCSFAGFTLGGIFLGLSASAAKVAVSPSTSKGLLAYLLLLGIAAFAALPLLLDQLDESMIAWEETAIDPFLIQRLDGSQLSSDQLQGKVVLLDFWGTWCSPCLRQFPKLQTLYQRYQDHPRFAFYAINSGDAGDDLDKVRAFAAANSYTFPFAFNHSGLADHFGISGLPYTLVLDGQGRIRVRHQGYSGNDLNALDAAIETLLAQEQDHN